MLPLRRMDKRAYKRDRFNGIVLGVVTNNEDPENRGRVKLRIPSILGSNEESPWALPMIPFKGWQIIPEVGDPVFVMFRGGRLDKPIYSSAWYLADKMPDPDNLDKHYLYSWDERKFVISVHPKEHKIEIKNDKDFKVILQEDSLVAHNKEETAKITLKEDGEVEVIAKKTKVIVEEDAEVQVGKSANVTVAEQANLTAKEVNVTAQTVANVDAPTVNLAGGGPGVARIGDEVEVTVTYGNSAGTHRGFIVGSSTKVNSG